ERDYTVAAEMLKALGIASIQLLSNNPKKFAGLKQNGIQIDARVPHIMPANKHNHFYLETKAKRSGHLIDLNTV
ncbi:GTP cyclohydrolase II, partial [bacterium]|nr:GTP cyclohydrolase II [bacterium]